MLAAIDDSGMIAQNDSLDGNSRDAPGHRVVQTTDGNFAIKTGEHSHVS